jgi:archaellum component FlaC
MAYTKVEYTPVNWKNKSEGLLTPLGKKNLNVMDEGISKVAEQLDEVYRSFSEEINKIPTMQTKVDEFESTISTLNSTVTTLNSDFTTVKQNVDTLSTTVTRLNKSVQDNESAIGRVTVEVSNALVQPRLIKAEIQNGDEFDFYDFSKTVALIVKGHAKFGNSTSEYFYEFIPFQEKGVFPAKIVPLLIKSGVTGVGIDSMENPSNSVTIGYRIRIRITPDENKGTVIVSEYSVKPSTVGANVTKSSFDLYVLETSN